jgi:hypothetical protein
MMAFVSMCKEHKKYAEFCNYEEFAKTEFLKKGRGCVWLDTTNFVSRHLTQTSGTCEMSEMYVSFDQITPEDENDLELLERIREYNPVSEYVLLQVADNH